jgi:hypothetical protein
VNCSMTCRKGSLLLKVLVSNHRYDYCNGKLFTDYKTTGIKAARTLYRLLYGTWEYYYYDVHKALFVQTIQFHRRWEKRKIVAD